MINTIKSIRSLGKSKKALKRAVCLYGQKQKKLDPHARERIESLLTDLQAAILQKQAEMAKHLTKQIESESLHLMPQSTWDKTKGFIGGIVFALLIAIVIRQMWFEFYSIPTGSMRPTLKEGDYLVVSKTDYGINTPLRSGHLYFDSTLVERGSIVVWTGENMDMPDDSTMYFYVIPGKKQYIKRLIGKPGDTLYFYGGKIYAIDQKGNDLKELREPKYFQTLEHIPFIRPEGKVETPSQSTAIVYQMGEPLAKLTVNSLGQVNGETIGQKGHEKLKSYSDFWGFKNYAMTRLLTGLQVQSLHPGAIDRLEPGLLYLEIHHHPSIQTAKLMHDDQGRVRPGLGTSVSLLPLQKEHLAQILSHMTTARFIVKNERVYRYGSGTKNESIRPHLPGVPDGTYEFQNGHGAKVLFGGITKSLSQDHPLLNQDPIQIQALYNLGFEWARYFEPSQNAPFPSRYAYFRDGDLYLMGGAIMQKNDPLLTTFLKRERESQAISTSVKPYVPFQDTGAPINEAGEIDAAFIKKYGVTVPDKMYLVMGDNHAMSADSRLFGFVPQANLRGGASLLFWPAGDRFGRHPQASVKHLTVPNVTVLAIAALAGTIGFFYTRKKYYKPFSFTRKK
jgi:signal peptidase I